MNSSSDYRLSRDVLPESYDLTLSIDIENARFWGICRAAVKVLKPTREITLNAADLNITRAELNEAEAETTTAEAEAETTITKPTATITSRTLQPEYDNAKERVSLVADEVIQLGNYILSTHFDGEMNEQLRGLYVSTFHTTPENPTSAPTDTRDAEPASTQTPAPESTHPQTPAPAPVLQKMALTQFESTNARRVFPCWDEPDFKAIFKVTLIVAEDLLAVSSMSVTQTSTQTNTQTDTQADTHTNTRTKKLSFAPTPKLSPYLLAFVVGPLEATTAPATSATTESSADPATPASPANPANPTHSASLSASLPTPIRIIHPKAQGHLCRFATEVAGFSLKYLSDYFGSPYMGDKLDLVAAPDFAFGAMENLGCVTFREVLLLLDEQQASLGELRRAVDVIAHELAHMWFGNLVTMRWWNGIWLKEGFATFMELLVCDAFRPEWRRWDYFCLSRSAAMDVDALWETRPVEYPVHSPAEAEGMYDLLSYEKGAAVVRMLQQFMTPEVFQKGVRNYLQKFAYDNCETEDLWEALDETYTAAQAGAPEGKFSTCTSSGMTSSGMMSSRMTSSWIFQPGFPLVKLEKLRPGEWKISQERFTYLPAELRDSTSADPTDSPRPNDPLHGPNDPAASLNHYGSGPLWHIPLVLSFGGVDGERQTMRLTLSEESSRINVPPDTTWMLADTGGNSFMRCAFGKSASGREIFGQAPESKALLATRSQLHPRERFGMLDDAWSLLLAGRYDPACFMQLLSTSKPDEPNKTGKNSKPDEPHKPDELDKLARDVAVWELTLRIAQSLHNMLPAQSLGAYAVWLKQLLQPTFLRLGGLASYNPESTFPAISDPNLEVLHAKIFSSLVRLAGDEELLNWARQAVTPKNFTTTDNKQEIPSSLLVECIRSTASFADTATCEDFIQCFKTATTPIEQNRYLDAMSLFPAKQDFQSVLEMTLTTDIRSQDAPYLLRSALAHRSHGELAWNFIKENWGKMNDRFPSSSIPRMLEGVRFLSDTTDIAEFLNSNPVPQGEKIIAQHLEKQRVNANFKRVGARQLGAWLALMLPTLTETNTNQKRH